MDIPSDKTPWETVLRQHDGGLPGRRELRESPRPRGIAGPDGGNIGGRPGSHLFDLLQGAGTSAPLALPLGVDDGGVPVWLDLHCGHSHHLLIDGGDRTSRSEVLRAVVIGAALKARPAQLQVLGIDASGRELTVLETLPHVVAETAIDRASARASLLWLVADLEARLGEGRRWPDMLLVIDDVESLAGGDSGRSRAALARLMRSGGPWGIHVAAGACGLTGGLRSSGWSRADVARLTVGTPPGWFALAFGSRARRLAGVQLSASDLDAVAKGFGPR